MELTAIALRGLDQAQAKLEQAGASLGSIGSATSGGAGVDTVSLSGAAVSLLSARNQFAANIQMLKIADDMQRQTISLLG